MATWLMSKCLLWFRRSPEVTHLRPQVRSSLDPLQFAQLPPLGVGDAAIYLLQRGRNLSRLWGDFGPEMQTQMLGGNEQV